MAGGDRYLAQTELLIRLGSLSFVGMSLDRLMGQSLVSL